MNLPDLSFHDEDEAIPLPRERRKDQRYLLELAITLQGDNNFYTGLSENISEGGVFIATSTVLAVGTHVVLEFSLPDMAAPLRVGGRVQWTREPDAMSLPGNVFGNLESNEVLPGMGIKFVGIDRDAIYAIRQFMMLRLPDFYDE